MAELDYAFLAEFASIQPNGTLNVLNASYTSVTVPMLPGQHLLSIAGRVRAQEGEPPNQLTIRVRNAPVFELAMEVPLADSSASRPYDGKVGRLFALTTLIPTPAAGLYEVLVELDGEQVRRLAFDVELQPQAR
ncbi:hypothetical protein SAMN05443575_1329 [Jatrophihabitans endophyticus]|uniref:Uncharacterized protein n=1 Tax=Jatrophihabitans endophyticus TaxID=1206085 RepID=A0A1M5GXZ6_9ACTN|nr:hypothetical protein [Jatrophihabitans endophyticus]SHG08594.1 hypothetical protein SAMN05443575_1329 [Jatrophihabitans endophyticus]